MGTVTRRDPGQVLQLAFDEPTQSLRTTQGMNGGGSQEIVINQADDSIAIGDGTTLYTGTTENGKHGLDVNVLNQIDFTASGLSQGLATYSVTVTDSPTLIPTIANQNGISIRVFGSPDVYFGNSSVTTSNGYLKRQFEEITLDIQNNTAVQIYAVCASGQSCELRVLAVA